MPPAIIKLIIQLSIPPQTWTVNLMFCFASQKPILDENNEIEKQFDKQIHSFMMLPIKNSLTWLR